ncbi:MAG TPA: 8-amino-7-oxononanoate synthase [Thermosulfurimonas dismutans]|uniref:8-amino-7-oxononanoate synthase n=1 Tax=Thermosulfurimonas dismutans TaxID=999894 RepID=A0A7C3GS72_9BACT|nr:8-amino-7-oxononanoate synthase [Thermosulfurimonas dismutans]
MNEEIWRELEELERKGRRRRLRTVEARRGPWVRVSGRWLLNLSSNDYLGFSAEPPEISALAEILERFGLGAGAARLLSGNHALYAELEEELARLYGRPALIFSSGYLANLGVLSGLCGRRDAIFSDKLVHASLIDGMRLSGAAFYRYPHLDLEALEGLLKKYRGKHRRAVILTESVFSMDGDFPDLSALSELSARYEALLVVDEAHAVGVFGERSLGLSEELGVLSRVDVLVGTFGKALGSYGAFVVAREEIRELLVNRARSFIFTTALPAVVVAGALAGLKRAVAAVDRRGRVRKLSRFLRKALGLPTEGLSSEVPIVPVILGEDRRALSVSERLYEAGFLAPAIRPPTVPEGTARLRLSLSATMEEHDLLRLADHLKDEICGPHS